jgi:Na+-transporting methylmalonyl-CoA/oxaloacetate decarboxylase gamma subunit
MIMSSLAPFGLLSLLTLIGMPIAFIFLLIWINQIKKYGEIQVEQNKKIIQLLEKEKIDET